MGAQSLGRACTVVALHVAAVLGSVAPSNATATPLPTYTLTVLPDTYYREELRVTEAGVPYIAALPFDIPGFQGLAFNSAGTYAGYCWTPFSGFPSAACTYSASAGINGIAFHTLPSTYSQWYTTMAYDVNDRGDVLGGATNWNTGNTNLDLQIRLATGELIDLPGLTSYRRASFNSRLEVVGGGVYADPFYYADGVRTPLANLVSNLMTPNGPFLLVTPTDINEAGVIVGVGGDGLDEDGKWRLRGFMLTPQVVPEPDTGLLAAVAMLGVLAVQVGRRDRA